MPAYIIAQFDITNCQGFDAYRDAAPPIVEAYGGRFLVNGGDIISVEGQIDQRRMIVLEFPDRAAAEHFYNSPEYREIMPLRHKNTFGTVSIVEDSV